MSRRRFNYQLRKLKAYLVSYELEYYINSSPADILVGASIGSTAMLASMLAFNVTTLSAWWLLLTFSPFVCMVMLLSLITHLKGQE